MRAIIVVVLLPDPGVLAGVANVDELLEIQQLCPQSLNRAALKAGMDQKTARKYRDSGKHPSELLAVHDWRTWVDPAEEVWPEVPVLLEINPGLTERSPSVETWRLLAAARSRRQ